MYRPADGARRNCAISAGHRLNDRLVEALVEAEYGPVHPFARVVYLLVFGEGFGVVGRCGGAPRQDGNREDHGGAPNELHYVTRARHFA